jgi:hypothetical protein
VTKQFIPQRFREENIRDERVFALEETAVLQVVNAG